MNLFTKRVFPFFRWKKEEKFKTSNYNEDEILKCYDKIFKLEMKLYEYHNFESNAKLISQNGYINYFDVTNKGEIVVISYNGSDLKGNNIFLNNLLEEPNFCNYYISTEDYEDEKFIQLLNMVHIQNINPNLMLVISEFVCRSKNRGYGSVLLSHCCETAKRKGFKYVVGELAFVDRERHPQLERLYKRLGFEVHYIPEKSRGVIIKYL